MLLLSDVYCKINRPVISNYSLFSVFNTFVLFFIFGPNFVIAQFGKDTLKVSAIAKVKESSIVIRWSPNNIKTWESGNNAGYIVERVTLVKDGKILKAPVKVRLTTSPLKPQPEAVFGQYYEKSKDQLLAVGAQALYGKTFEIKSKDLSLKEIADKATETENRFGFALFSADQSAEVAELMGLRIIDNAKVKGEKYVYKIFIPVTSAGIHMDTAYVFIESDAVIKYRAPKNYFSEFGDKIVKLSWDIKIHCNYFSSYQIERRKDGEKDWTVRNQQPFVPMSPAGVPLETAVFYDSLPDNNKIYHYRIKSKDYFGEFAEEVMTFSGFGRPALTVKPEITSITPIDKKKLAIVWSFPAEEQKNVLSFIIYSSKKPNGLFKKQTVSKPADRGTQISLIHGYNYYKVAALGVDSNEYASAAMLFQIDDEEPPKSPAGLKGEVDSTGTVRIYWKANTEPDFYGYRIFRANEKTEEFVNISRKMDRDTVFTDTINLNTLSTKIYYKIAALDNRFNQSELSTVLELKRPDKIPPSPPVIANYEANEKGVKLEWIASTSLDIRGHLILRSLAGSNDWSILAKYGATTTGGVFKDSTGQQCAFYEYAVLAVDESKNETFSNIVRAVKTDQGIRPGADKIVVKANREALQVELKWKSPSNNIAKTLIYRSKAEEPLRLYRDIQGSQNEFQDKNVAYGAKYIYRIMYVYNDGGRSPLSEKVSVEF